MNIVPSTAGDLLTLTVAGRLGADTATELDKNWIVPGVARLTVDLGGCSFVSSAGLRVFIKLAREANNTAVAFALVNVQPSAYQVLEMTGLTQLMQIRRKARQISIEGLEFLSAGVCGQCFRLDPETVVKLYNEGVAPEVAEQEKTFARAALIAGIPTALSYDVVACGSRTGVIYEMLDAQLFSRIIAAEPTAASQYGKQLAEIAQNIHSKVGDKAVFQDLKPRMRGYIENLRGPLSDRDIAHLLARLECIPDAETLVHFDLHTSNIMIRDGEAVIIDMGDVSRGHYLFDVGVIAMIYAYPESGNCEFVTKVPNAIGRQLYESFLGAYFAGRPVKDFEFFIRNEAFLASLRLIAAIAFLPAAKDALLEKVRDFLLPRIYAESRQQ